MLEDVQSIPINPMKIHRLGFQAMPKDSLFPVRALRMVDDSEDASKDELLSTRGIGDKQTMLAVIDSFKREYPHGRVEIEGEAPDFVSLPANGHNINRLFDGKTTF